MYRSPGPAEVATQPLQRQPSPRQVAAWRQPGPRERILALQAAAGNRAVARAVIPRLQVARAPPVKPPPVKPPPVSPPSSQPPAGAGRPASQDGWVIHPEAMKLLESKLRSLYERIPRRDRIWLQADSTVAIGMATIDGSEQLVYTVANNKGSRAFHDAAEQLGLHRWTYDTDVKGRGPVGSPNDAEQLMIQHARDTDAVLHGMVVSRRLCADCATVIPNYRGGRLRVQVVLDTADLPSPRGGRPAPTGPPARSTSGTVQTAELPEGSVFKRPPEPTVFDVQPSILVEPPGAPAKSAPAPPIAAAPKGTPLEAAATKPPPEVPADVPVTVPANIRAGIRSALATGGFMGVSFLAGLGISYYLARLFERDWADAMKGVEGWLTTYLPLHRFSFPDGTPLFAVVSVDVDAGSMHMADASWSPRRTGVSVQAIRVTDHPVETKRSVEKSPWWLAGNMYEITHITFSFPVPVKGARPR